MSTSGCACRKTSVRTKGEGEKDLENPTYVQPENKGSGQTNKASNMADNHNTGELTLYDLMCTMTGMEARLTTRMNNIEGK